MEGLKVIEKSYTNLINFKEAITGNSFSTATQLVINLKNYDIQTQSGIRDALKAVLEAYKDDLTDVNINKVLVGDSITIKIPNDIDGFRDDLVDSLRCYIEKRAPSLWTIITNSSLSGGMFGV